MRRDVSGSMMERMIVPVRCAGRRDPWIMVGGGS